MNIDLDALLAKALLYEFDIMNDCGEKLCVKCYKENKKRVSLRKTREENIYNCPFCACLKIDKKEIIRK